MFPLPLPAQRPVPLVAQPLIRQHLGPCPRPVLRGRAGPFSPCVIPKDVSQGGDTTTVATPGTAWKAGIIDLEWRGVGGRGRPLSRDLRTDLGPDAKPGYEGTDGDQVFRTAVRSGVLCPIRVCEAQEVAAGSKLLPQRGVPSFIRFTLWATHAPDVSHPVPWARI